MIVEWVKEEKSESFCYKKQTKDCVINFNKLII